MPFDRYNNKLTVHIYATAKSLTVAFTEETAYSQACLTSKGARGPLNGYSLPGQADSWQEIATRLGIDVATFCDIKQPQLRPFGYLKVFELDPATLWLPSTHSYRSTCSID